MDERTRTLVELSALASRPEHQSRLQKKLLLAKNEGIAKRSEIYECFLQLYLFAGFPAALEAMRALANAWPQDRVEQPEGDPLSYPAFLDRGRNFFDLIYAENAERVKKAMAKLSPELSRWALIDGYSRTLSRPGLDAVTRELAIVAVLTQLGWQRQLLSHMLGALNAGASREDMKLAIEIGALDDAFKVSQAVELEAKMK
jgi:4-carboxymuconolactone decarboxylase